MNEVDLIQTTSYSLPSISVIAVISGLGLGLAWILTGIYAIRFGWKRRPLWTFAIGFLAVIGVSLIILLGNPDNKAYQLYCLLRFPALYFCLVALLICLYPFIEKNSRLGGKNKLWKIPFDSRLYKIFDYFRKEWPLTLSIVILTGAFLIFGSINQFYPFEGDVFLYFKYADFMLSGKMPFQDFFLEYPPFSLFFFALPALASKLLGGLSLERYTFFFQFNSYLLALGTLILISGLWKKLNPGANFARGVFFFTFSTLIVSYYVFWRFDLSATFLVALALYLIYINKPGWAGAVLGLAVVTKLYPLILLPAILIYYLHRKGHWKFGIRTTFGFSLTIIAVVLPFIITGMPGIINFLRYHSERGIQVESLFASITWLGELLGFITATVIYDHGSYNILSDWTSFLSSSSTFLIVGGLVVFYLYFWRTNPNRDQLLHTDWLLQAAALLVMWFVITNKVFSPQYMVWLIPFVPFFKGIKSWMAVVIMVLSYIAYPFMMTGLKAIDWQPMMVLLVRNLLLLLLFALQFIEFSRTSGKILGARTIRLT